MTGIQLNRLLDLFQRWVELQEKRLELEFPPAPEIEDKTKRASKAKSPANGGRSRAVVAEGRDGRGLIRPAIRRPEDHEGGRELSKFWRE
ncbi:MAG: hypothetical protein ACLPNY_21845 [Roseiarcus sp.]